jgi:hypothetical protein
MDSISWDQKRIISRKKVKGHDPEASQWYTSEDCVSRQKRENQEETRVSRKLQKEENKKVLQERLSMKEYRLSIEV